MLFCLLRPVVAYSDESLEAGVIAPARRRMGATEDGSASTHGQLHFDLLEPASSKPSFTKLKFSSGRGKSYISVVSSSKSDGTTAKHCGSTSYGSDGVQNNNASASICSPCSPESAPKDKLISASRGQGEVHAELGTVTPQLEAKPEPVAVQKQDSNNAAVCEEAASQKARKVAVGGSEAKDREQAQRLQATTLSIPSTPSSPSKTRKCSRLNVEYPSLKEFEFLHTIGKWVPFDRLLIEVTVALQRVLSQAEPESVSKNDEHGLKLLYC